MIITVTGLPGSGNSSLAKNLAQKLKMIHYSIGDLRRNIAKRHNITLMELNKIGESEDWTDMEVDALAKQLGENEDNFVMDGKIAYAMIPKSLKIFLKADLEVRAQRIYQDTRETENPLDLEQTKQMIQERVEGDKRRYKKYYDLETYTGEGFDLVLDTTNLDIEGMTQKVLDHLKSANFI